MKKKELIYSKTCNVSHYQLGPALKKNPYIYIIGLSDFKRIFLALLHSATSEEASLKLSTDLVWTVTTVVLVVPGQGQNGSKLLLP